MCLRCWDWSETSQTVAVFTRLHGVVRGIAKGSRRDRSAFSGGFEPMTLGELRAFTKASSELATLAGWDLLEPYRELRGQLSAHYAGCYLIDLTYHALPVEDPHPELFDALVDALGMFTSVPLDQARRDRAMLCFHIALLHETGYRPELFSANEDNGRVRGGVGVFDPARGELAQWSGGARAHARMWKIRLETIVLLRHALEAPLSELGPLMDQDADEAIARANAFLVSYTAVVLDRVVPSLPFVYPTSADRAADFLGH